MSLPGGIEREPGLDRWIRIDANGTITAFSGKVEIGQGIRTALTMIVAEELDVSASRVHVHTADTALTPNEGVTSGSMSIQDSGGALRVAAAYARQLLLRAAAERLQVSISDLTVTDGSVRSKASNEMTDYWQLQGGRPFDATMTSLPPLKTRAQYTIVGGTLERVDLPAKLRGEPCYVHDLQLPDMLHARVVKPPEQGGVLRRAPARVEGGWLFRRGSYLVVAAEREIEAVRLCAQVAAGCDWSLQPIAPESAELGAYLREHVTQSLPVVDGTPVEDEPAAPESRADVAHTYYASYSRPFQMHAALAPSAAAAQLVDGRLTVYSHSQGVELLKVTLAQVLAMDPARVRVVHVEGSGCYGHNGADDVALDAALAAQALSPRPVLVKWTREQEHIHEPYAPPAAIDMQASVDARGRIVDWRHAAFSMTHLGRPRPSRQATNLQTAWLLDPPWPRVPPQPARFKEVGIHRNMAPIYDFPQQVLRKHFVAQGPFRTSAMRSLGAFANVFAIESFMDEIAACLGEDPVQLRLRHLRDASATALLERLQEVSRDHPCGAMGRGVALARYKNQQTCCAVMVDLDVTDAAEVRLARVWIFADAGLVIDSDGLRNQLEGGFVQAASWTLKEAVTWDRDGVTSRDWEDYPILRFSEVPEITTELMDTDRPAVGAGEAASGPTPAAIANALYAATGLRVRDLPLTPERLREVAAH